MRKRSLVPTEHELEIMKVLWTRGHATVREVYEDLRQQRPVAYTTVMTMLGVLEGKEHVEKLAGNERAFTYRPVRPREEVVASMVAEFTTRVFNGSGRDLVEHLLQTGSVSREDLLEISRLPED